MQEELSLILNKIKSWAKRNNAVDIILFGSFARGNLDARDIDLCIIIKDQDEKKALNLLQSFNEFTNSKFHIQILTSSSLILGNTLTKALLSEGYSISKNKE